MRFADLVLAAQERVRSMLAVALAPVINRLPYDIQRYDDPFLPFGKAVIDATADLACGYVFHLSAYLALGGAGAVALERTMAYVPAGAIKILHGPFANSEYVTAVFDNGFGAEAVTLAGSSRSLAHPYLQSDQCGIFVPAGSNLRDVEALTKTYAGQVGIYNPESLLFTLYLGNRVDTDTCLSIKTDSRVAYTSQGSDYREAIRAAAEQFQIRSR